jgi:hypothetical protein
MRFGGGAGRDRLAVEAHRYVELPFHLKAVGFVKEPDRFFEALSLVHGFSFF